MEKIPICFHSLMALLLAEQIPDCYSRQIASGHLPYLQRLFQTGLLPVAIFLDDSMSSDANSTIQKTTCDRKVSQRTSS